MRSFTLLALAILSLASFAQADFTEQLQADWLLGEEILGSNGVASTQSDAMGGCDGVKEGAWGFHTNLSDSPWWQVDLGAIQQVSKVIVWNRCDTPDRTVALQIAFSDDGLTWRTVYTHDGTNFYGGKGGPPLTVNLQPQDTRFVRASIPGSAYLHLDEVEVFSAAAPESNLALNKPADQSSISPWSKNHMRVEPDWPVRVAAVLERAMALADKLAAIGLDMNTSRQQIASIATFPHQQMGKQQYLEARRILRTLSLSNPILQDFDTILFVKRVPGSFSHMSDQYYGWWSRPGGGIYLLRGFKSDSPETTCITDAFTEPGNFLRPSLSYDGTKVLFAWCKHYPALAAEKDKLNKDNVPEDAFYHVFEMNLDGSNLRKLTQGKYDDFDARYLPDGRIIFLSTRRGQFLRCGPDTACQTQQNPAQPDSYVRCGGGPERPVAVYTLHTMSADGDNLCAISPFEMFEWTPSIAHDGTILYSRWDYIDRSNMPYMSLWSIHPDGSHARIVYKNYTLAPHCTFEPQSIPNSNKIIFTGAPHHGQTLGSLVLLDPTVGSEGTSPITRLTPEIAFPEIEGWSGNYYTSPWPLSEQEYLVSWGQETEANQGTIRRVNGMGLYFFDTSGMRELLYRDPEIGCECPLPVRARPVPPVVSDMPKWNVAQEGRFVLSDVYSGLQKIPRGTVKSLRIVAVPPKTHPVMNFPPMGIIGDDPGKCVLGTVPVEEDGSANFRVPASLILFFQALDKNGMTIQTMRSATYTQPGQTTSCIGCHESRHAAPPATRPIAAMREPSRLTPGPEGSWPMRYDRMVQPMLDRLCVSCHNPGSDDNKAAKTDLTAEKSYDTLVDYGEPSLRTHVKTGYQRGYSIVGQGPAVTNPLVALLFTPEGHKGVILDPGDRERLITWLDVYGQRLGSFSEEQERQLVALREEQRALIAE